MAVSMRAAVQLYSRSTPELNPTIRNTAIDGDNDNDDDGIDVVLCNDACCCFCIHCC